MREAIHIFLKDSRQLRYPVAVVLAWTAILVMAGAASPQPYQRVEGWFGAFGYVVTTPALSPLLLPAAWWYLVSRALHAEALPGDRQFWLTRPYRRGSLFGAKALFVLAYITVPLAASQSLSLVLKGFPLAPHLLGILWTQVLILAIVVLPAAALASITSTLGQFVTIGFAAPLLFLAKNLLTPWAALDWIRDGVAICLIVPVTISVLLLQFTRRRTSASRMIALGGILALVAILPLLSWRTAYAVQSQSSHLQSGAVTAELVRPASNRPQRPDVTWPVLLSFRVVGPQPGTPIACDAAETMLESPERVWSIGLEGIGRVGGGQVVPGETASDGCIIQVPGVLVSEVGDRLVNLHAVLYVTVFGAQQGSAVTVDKPPTFVRGTGVCGGTTMHRQVTLRGQPVDESLTFVGCQNAFRDPAGPTVLSSPRSSSPHVSGRFSYSPFPADLRIEPIGSGASATFRPVDVVTVVTLEPIAHLRLTVDVPAVHLRDLQ